MLQVKNWAQFQHYGDRNPVWVKLYLSLLDDYAFAQLTDAQRGQLVMIWLLAARNKGVIPHDDRWVASRIASSGRFRLQTFIDAGFLVGAETEDGASNPLAQIGRVASVEKRRDREEK